MRRQTRTTRDCKKVGAMTGDQRMVGDCDIWWVRWQQQGRPRSCPRPSFHHLHQRRSLSRAMATQQRRRISINDTDEEIPALQSPSDSSESEDEPPQPPQPTTGQHPPPRPLAADVFDSDDSDITENGNVILLPDSQPDNRCRCSAPIPCSFLRCALRKGAITAVPAIHEPIPISVQSTRGQRNRYRIFKLIGGPVPPQFQRRRRRSRQSPKPE